MTSKRSGGLPPGGNVPFSGQYEIRGPRGVSTGAERTMVQGTTAPPTPKPGQTFVLVDPTNNGAGRKR